jgi:hypothetical protein
MPREVAPEGSVEIHGQSGRPKYRRTDVSQPQGTVARNKAAGQVWEEYLYSQAVGSVGEDECGMGLSATRADTKEAPSSRQAALSGKKLRFGYWRLHVC